MMKFEILGEPVGKGRPRVAMRGEHPHLYTPQSTAEWEQVCAQFSRIEARRQGVTIPLPGNVGVLVIALQSRPKKYMRKKDPDGVMLRQTKPDIDNVVKSVLDGMVKGGVLQDDADVVHVEAYNGYAEKDGTGRVLVKTYQVEDEWLTAAIRQW